MASSSVQRIFNQMVDGGADTTSLVHRMCRACAIAVPADGVGLTAPSHRPAGLRAATGHRAAAVQALEYTTAEGPGVDAASWHRPVLQPNLRQTAPTRWPEFGPAALDNGIEAIFAFPLLLGGIGLGVLTLYRTTAGDLKPPQLRQALGHVDAATAMLLHLHDQTPPSVSMPPNLTGPARAEVHQATGMIAVQAGVDITQGLLLLRMHAYLSNRSVLGVAEDVVHRVIVFSRDFDPDQYDRDG